MNSINNIKINTETKTINFSDVDITVKKNISLLEAMILIDTVTEMSFDDDGGYTPECTDYVLRLQTIEKYTDLELPVSLEERYALVYNTSLYDEVMSYIDQTQYAEIVHATNKKIGHYVRTNEKALTNKIEKLIDEFEKLSASISEIYTGISPEQMQSLVTTISENGFDEKKIVEAYKETIGLGK